MALNAIVEVPALAVEPPLLPGVRHTNKLLSMFAWNNVAVVAAAYPPHPPSPPPPPHLCSTLKNIILDVEEEILHGSLSIKYSSTTDPTCCEVAHEALSLTRL
jgi:hypothetical protein